MCLFVLQQTKRKLDDANKRLEFLYDKLREQTVSSVLLPSTPLLLMASLVQYYFCSMQQGYIFFRSVLQIHLLEVYMDFLENSQCLALHACADFAVLFWGHVMSFMVLCWGKEQSSLQQELRHTAWGKKRTQGTLMLEAHWFHWKADVQVLLKIW